MRDAIGACRDFPRSLPASSIANYHTLRYSSRLLASLSVPHVQRNDALERTVASRSDLSGRSRCTRARYIDRERAAQPGKKETNASLVAGRKRQAESESAR